MMRPAFVNEGGAFFWRLPLSLLEIQAAGTVMYNSGQLRRPVWSPSLRRLVAAINSDCRAANLDRLAANMHQRAPIRKVANLDRLAANMHQRAPIRKAANLDRSAANMHQRAPIRKAANLDRLAANIHQRAATR